VFVWYEPWRSDPLLDLRFFRSVPFSSATLLGLNAFSGCGFSAFYTGLLTLPLAVMTTVTAPWSERLVGHFGTRRSSLTSGAAFLASTLMLTRK